MSFKYISDKYPRDRDLPQRAFDLSLREKLLNGTFYDILPFQFHEETRAGRYIPLAERQPAVKSGTNMLRTIVDDTVSMTMGEGRFPEIDTTNDEARKMLADLIKETKLVQVMRDAMFRGSIGSVAIMMRVLKSRVFWEVLDTKHLTPEYDPEEPDRLTGVTLKYKITGEALKAQGYVVSKDDLHAKFWFQWKLDDIGEWWFLPWRCDSDTDEKPHTPVVDDERTVAHYLGFVPLKWIKNLHGGDDIDGGCTFVAGIDDCFEIDKQMSQVGRGLKYSQDPLLLIKEPATAQEFDGKTGIEVQEVEGQGPAPVKSPAQELVVQTSGDGDAKFLEINGTASKAVLEYVNALSSAANEAMKGNRINPDQIGAGPRGSKALEIVQGPLIMLCDNLRYSYGEDGLLSLLNMVLRVIRERGAIVVNGKRVPATAGQVDDLSLRWGAWYPPNEADNQAEATTLAQLTGAHLLSRKTAIKTLAANLDIESVEAEMALIEAERAVEDARMLAMAAEQAKSSASLSAKIA